MISKILCSAVICALQRSVGVGVSVLSRTALCRLQQRHFKILTDYITPLKGSLTGYITHIFIYKIILRS